MMWDCGAAIVLIATLVRSIRTICDEPPRKKRPRGWVRPFQADRFKLTSRGRSSRGEGRNSHAVGRNTPAPGGNRPVVAHTPAVAVRSTQAVVRRKPVAVAHTRAAAHRPHGVG